MRLLFLGVGGWISKPALGHTSIALVPSSKRALLIDAGEGVLNALYGHGLRLSDLSGIVITHIHGDHVLGLPSIIMFAKHYEGVRGLPVYAPREIISDLGMFLKIVGADYAGIVELHGISPGVVVHLGEFSIHAERAIHPVPALSLRVEAEGKCVAYSGDTAYNPSLVELTRKCDLLIHEASGYSEEAHAHGHSTVQDAVEIAKRSGVKRLVLVHYYLDIPPIKVALPKDLELLLAYPGYELDL